MLHRITSVSLIAVSSVAAQPPDKSSYSLLNPTPRELMREMSTDRPDATESPYTVDAGHFQAELSFFDFSRSDEGRVRIHSPTRR